MVSLFTQRPKFFTIQYKRLFKKSIPWRIMSGTPEQIYLRQNFRELIDKNAVRIVGPDQEDIGGIAELKWEVQYADMHSIQMAPHGIFDRLIGPVTHAQVGATMPENFITFEYPVANQPWRYEIIKGLLSTIVTESLIDVRDRPGLGLDFNIKAARTYPSEEDKKIFD